MQIQSHCRDILCFFIHATFRLYTTSILLEVYEALMFACAFNFRQKYQFHE